MIPFNYYQPDLIQLLIILSFFYLLQCFGHYFNLLGQILVGLVYSLGNLLPIEFEATFLVLGYIGLILLIFENGLCFNLTTFKSTITLSLVTASIGILLPIAFTFALFSSSFYSLSPLNSFIIGSALSSTSLGTTLSVLSTTLDGQLLATRLGSILTSAALIDDVISLVLLSIIQSLGSTSLGWNIARPVVAAILLVIVTMLLVQYALIPLFKRFGWEEKMEVLSSSRLLFLGVFVLSAFLAISFYSGTTVLLGAYLAGVILSLPSPSSQKAFQKTYSVHISQIQSYIFLPLFFASIGYSIPFLSLFNPSTLILKGFLYAILMSLAKLLAGSSLLFFNESSTPSPSIPLPPLPSFSYSTAAELSSPRLPCPPVPPITITKSHNLVSPLLLGSALIARGEIGILILQIAISNTDNGLEQEAYLIGIWAVVLCTILGPLLVRGLVRGGRGLQVIEGRWGVIS